MDKDNPISGMRKNYQLNALSENDVNADPIKQFLTWWQYAIDAKTEEPNAMAVATCSKDGKPSARMVLLKEITENGFVFFTNYESRKAKEIAENPNVALLFFWKELERQVRIEGKIQKIPTAESDEYFALRPRESQIGAWSSPQSTVIKNAMFLQENVQKFLERFNGQKVPRPDFWGGYIVQPTTIEFWQGRPGRLHDRILYIISDDKKWSIERLAP